MGQVTHAWTPLNPSAPRRSPGGYPAPRKQKCRGNVKFIFGMSGIELVRHILKMCGMEVGEYTDALHIDYPPEYWCGWILAYYPSGVPVNPFR